MNDQLLLLGYWEFTSTILLFFIFILYFQKVVVVGCLYDVKLQISFIITHGLEI